MMAPFQCMAGQIFVTNLNCLPVLVEIGPEVSARIFGDQMDSRSISKVLIDVALRFAVTSRTRWLRIHFAHVLGQIDGLTLVICEVDRTGWISGREEKLGLT